MLEIICTQTVSINGMTVIAGAKGMWAEDDKQFVFLDPPPVGEPMGKVLQFSAANLYAVRSNFQYDDQIAAILANRNSFPAAKVTT